MYLGDGTLRAVQMVTHFSMFTQCQYARLNWSPLVEDQQIGSLEIGLAHSNDKSKVDRDT